MLVIVAVEIEFVGGSFLLFCVYLLRRQQSSVLVWNMSQDAAVQATGISLSAYPNLRTSKFNNFASQRHMQFITLFRWFSPLGPTCCCLTGNKEFWLTRLLRWQPYRKHWLLRNGCWLQGCLWLTSRSGRCTATWVPAPTEDGCCIIAFSATSYHD